MRRQAMAVAIPHAEGQVKIIQLLMLTFMDDGVVADIMAQDTLEAPYDALMRQLHEKERGLWGERRKNE